MKSIASRRHCCGEPTPAWREINVFCPMRAGAQQEQNGDVAVKL